MNDHTKNLEALPEAYRLILLQAEDISEMTIVPYQELPELELVSRIHGWKPLPVARIVSAAQKRRSKDCPLCQADERSHSLTWHAYGVKKNVEAAVKAAHDAGLAGVSAKLVKNHLRNHNYNQPAPLKRISREAMLSITAGLSPRAQKILVSVYRQRALSTKQIISLFFEADTSSDESARKSAYRLLHELRFKHLLYPFRVEDKKSPEVYYSLGKYAVPFLEEHEGALSGEACVTRREQVKEYQLEHDLKAADVFVQLRRQVYTNRSKQNLVMVEGREMSFNLPAESWWGSRSLTIGYQTSQGEKVMVPDGFGTLQFNDGRKRQFQLPFFLEWDSGYKTIEDSAEQLFNYCLLGRSGAAGKRFPQLNYEKYMVPVLFVTSTPVRAQRLAGMVRDKAQQRGIPEDQAPLMLITDAETMQHSGWASGAWREVFADQPSGRSLAEQLLQGNQALTEGAPIHWRLPINIDLDGGMPASAKMPAFLR